jgi:hypothetical protein
MVRTQMTPKKMTLLAIAAASLGLPAVAAAQQYGQPDYGRRYGGYDQPYGGPRGDYDRAYGRRYGFQGYPEFRDIEDHIRQEIRESVRDDMIEPDDARDLMSQLQQIRYQEQREFQVHGWRLPDDDRERIGDRLQQLDHLVDETRDEQ